MSYEQVLNYLPESICRPLQMAPDVIRRTVREIRLRQGRPLCLILCGEPLFPTCEGAFFPHPTHGSIIPSESEMQAAFQRICGYSVQSWEEQLRQGFLTLPGGHRVGVAGTAVQRDGRISALREISSLNIRIARQVPGIAGDLVNRLYREGMPSVLLSGAPMSGKTTLLREMIAALSSGQTGRYRKIAVIDERGELGAVWGGVPQLELGPCTDVLTGYPKGEGMSIALRTLSPELMVCDEIGTEEEAAAIRMSLHAGTAVLVSAHASDLNALLRRTPLAQLLRDHVFDYLVQLAEGEPPGRIEEIRRWNIQEEPIDGKAFGSTAAVFERIGNGFSVGGRAERQGTAATADSKAVGDPFQ